MTNVIDFQKYATRLSDNFTNQIGSKIIRYEIYCIEDTWICETDEQIISAETYDQLMDQLNWNDEIDLTQNII